MNDKQEQRERFERKRPPKAQAIIVAELEQDDSDSMTDYFATKTTRCVAIGWRTGKREDFRQLRRAAATFPETAHLGPGKDVFRTVCVRATDDPTRGHWKGSYESGAGSGLHGNEFPTIEEAQVAIGEWSAREWLPEWCEWKVETSSVEHRETYSMGKGNYLKASGCYSSGWMVCSYPWPSNWAPICEDHLPELGKPNENGNGRVKVDAMTITENDEKGGLEIRFPAKPDESVRTALKANGWRWSRHFGCWYTRRTPEARGFADSLAGIGR